MIYELVVSLLSVGVHSWTYPMPYPLHWVPLLGLPSRILTPMKAIGDRNDVLS